MHSVPLSGACLVNNALEQPANRRVRQRSGIVALGVRQHFVFAVRLIQRKLGRLLELANFQRAL